MDPRLARLGYVLVYLLALMAFYLAWITVGGQYHLDLMPWYWKLAIPLAGAAAILKATQAAVEGERVWSARTLRWLILTLLAMTAAGLLTLYYHVNEPAEEEPEDATQTRLTQQLPPNLLS